MSDPPSPGPFAPAPGPPSSARPLPPVRWRLPLVLFVATVASLLVAGADYGSLPDEPLRPLRGVPFAAALLGILLAHELGHFVAARLHRVETSLPLFIPMPFVSAFGTMGAVIVMRGRIRSRDALVDIGASGPLAGMVVALPVTLVGLRQSAVQPLTEHGAQEGQCLLYALLKRVAVGPIPDGWDVYLSPVAFAGWVGLLVTMVNLIPVGQLDGGHVAYALFGRAQDRAARWVRWGILALAVGETAVFVVREIAAAGPGALVRRATEGGPPGAPPPGPIATALDVAGHALSASGAGPWIGFFVVLTVLLRVGGRDHPPTEPGPLSPARRAVAWGTIGLFAALFMPAPWAVR